MAKIKGWTKIVDDDSRLAYVNDVSGIRLVANRRRGSGKPVHGSYNSRGYGWIASHEANMVYPTKDAVRDSMIRFMSRRGWVVADFSDLKSLEDMSGDYYVDAWENHGVFLFIAKDGFGGFVLGEVSASPMSGPDVLGRSRDRGVLRKRALVHMRRHI